MDFRGEWQRINHANSAIPLLNRLNRSADLWLLLRDKGADYKSLPHDYNQGLGA